MSSLQASKLCLYKQFDVVPILKSLNTPYSFTIRNLVLLSQSERLSQNLSLNRCTSVSVEYSYVASRRSFVMIICNGTVDVA